MSSKKIKTPQEEAQDEKRRKEKAAISRAKTSEKTKPQRERMKRKIDARVPTTQYEADAAVENENNIRAFFKKMIDMPYDQAIEETIEFFDPNKKGKGKGTVGRKTQFKNIIIPLPSTLYKDLARNYLSQEKMLNVFWADYETRPYVIEEMQEKQRLEDQDFVKLHEPVEKHSRKTEQVLIKGTGVVKELDFDGKEIERQVKISEKKEHLVAPIMLMIDPLKDGCEEYTTIPWINNFQEMFIAPTQGVDQENFIKSMSLDPKTGRKQDGNTWYQVPTRIISNVLCVSRKFWERDFVRLNHKTKGNITFQIAYLLKDGKFEKQTEKNFRDEKSFVDTKLGRKDNEINKILASKVTPEIKQFARSILSDWLSNIAPEVKKYKNAEEASGYIRETVELLANSSPNAGKLFEHIAEITIFLNKKDGVFTERIRDEYYIPEILVGLSIEEKLPEVFDDPEANKDSANRFIKRQVDAAVKKFADQFHRIKNSTKSIETLPSAQIIPSHEERPWKSACKNEISKDVQNSSVIYYPENGEIYCILITEVYDQIKANKKPVNPSTGTPLDDKFLKRFRELYDHKFNRDDFEETTESLDIKQIQPPHVVESVKKHIIAPWLLETIIKNIKECEDELNSGSKERCKSFEDKDSETDASETVRDDDTPNKEKDKDDDSDYDTTVEEPNKDKDKDDDSDYDTPGEESSKDFSKKSVEERIKLVEEMFKSDDDDDDDDSDASGYSAGESPGDVIEGDICQSCRKKMTKKKKNVSSKTIIRNKKGEYKPVWFCNFDCFEKYRCPRTKKRKNNGKVRHASQDRKKK
jgi:hypothetical protein